MIPDAAIVRSGHGPKLDPPVIGFQRFQQLGTMGEQAMLQIDPDQGCGKLLDVG